MVQFGQKLPVLPLFGNMESLEPKPDEHQGMPLERAEAKRAFFGQMIECLLGIIAASLV
jgi:hypothetical protein